MVPRGGVRRMNALGQFPGSKRKVFNTWKRGDYLPDRLPVRSRF